MRVIPATPADRIAGALPVTRLAPVIPLLPAMETRVAIGRPRVLSRDGPRAFLTVIPGTAGIAVAMRPTIAAETRPPIEVETPPAIAAEIPPATRAETFPAIGGNTSHNPGDRSGDTAGNRDCSPSGYRGGNTAGSRDRNPSGNRGGYNAGNRGSMNNHRAPGRTVTLRGGGSASFRPNGQVRVIHRDGMRIQHNLRGGRTIVTERGGVRIVARGGGRGYVQRAYVTRGGRSFYSRTYYNRGVYRVGSIAATTTTSIATMAIIPAYWYRPVFYGWAYRPWGAPVYWGVGIGGWGWGPWYGYYGGYFAPYSVYPSAAFWLTDYVIAANLQAAYEARAEANAEHTIGATGTEQARRRTMVR